MDAKEYFIEKSGIDKNDPVLGTLDEAVCSWMQEYAEYYHAQQTLPSDGIPYSKIKNKLISMRFTKKQMKECDREGTLIAYGWTDCINKLLVYLKKQSSTNETN